MGVKGRRVAVVEEISNTVISFAKVPTNAKDRALTITGDNEEVIAHAKLLIEETIRRNQSPNRADGSFTELLKETDEHNHSGDEDRSLAENVGDQVRLVGGFETSFFSFHSGCPHWRAFDASS